MSTNHAPAVFRTALGPSVFFLTLVALWKFSAVPAQSAPAGLVAAYGFNEGSGTAVTDASGSGNGGTISGATRTASGKSGSALSFDGVNDWVTVNDAPSLDLTTGMTLEAWVFPTALSGWRTVMLKERSGHLAYATYANTSTGRPSGEIFTTTSSDTRGPAALALNAWTHLAVTYDGALLRLYVNGTQAASRAVSGSIIVSTGALRIGGNSVWGEYFQGRIDEVRIYNRALTAGEIQTDMNSPIGTPPPLDTTPPSTPTGLSAAAVSSSQISLAWTASTDNVGVTGYKVFRNGTQVTTVTTTSYQNTGLAASTTYTYTVAATDAAGNTSSQSTPASATTLAPSSDTAPPSTPTGLTATAVSSSRIDLAWNASTDNVGVTTYRVYRGAIPVATVTATSYSDTGLQPATTYSYTVAARDAAGNESPPSSQASATTPGVACGGGAMATYHTPQCNAAGKLIPWHIDAAGPFDYIMGIQAEWWLNAPNVNGWPTYLTAAKLYRNYTQNPGDAVPGSTASMAIEAYLKYYAYTGDGRYLTMARNIGNYVIQQALTPETYVAYPRFPWPAGRTGDITPDGAGQGNRAGDIMPDKGAMIGMALLRLYEATGDAAYRDAAVHIADVLANTVQPGTSSQSPWPFRAQGHSGTMVDGPLMGNQVFALRLYHELLRLGIPGNGKYQATRDTVWNWLKTVAIADTSGDKWMHFFEDHSGSEYNPTQFDALEVARYLLEKKEALEPNWFAMVNSIIDVVKARWVVHTGDYTAIGEQQQDMSPYNSHTARYASILAMFAEAGGPAAYKDEAYSSFAYSTYSVDHDGFADSYFNQGIAWSTDSFGDWMNHFMDGLGAVPEWAPGNSSHLLRSSSVIQSVSYGNRVIDYVAFDREGSEKLKLNFTPTEVRVDGSPVSSWTWNSATQVLAITRTTGTFVGIIGEGVTSDTTPPLPPTDLGATVISSSQINLAWTAASDNVAVTGYRLERCQGTGCSTFSQMATSTGTTYSDTGLLAATSYNYRVRATDAAGNLSPYSNTAGATTAVSPPADTTPPTTPSNVAAAADSGSQITLGWTASTDDVGVTGYRVERCQGAGCNSFTEIASPTGTTYTDTGLLAATSYSYRVRARDAAGNLSPYSNTASATTPAQSGGLVAAYSFKEGSGAGVADASGTGNPGTISGASWTAQGKFGSALSFDGVNDWVTINDAASLDLTTGMTLEAWVFPTALSGWRTVMLKERSGHLAYATYANTDSGRPSGEIFTTTSNDTRAAAALLLNAWTHLAVTYDGAVLRLYVNGTQVSSRVVSGSIITSTGALRIGGNSVWGEYFQGRIDEVRIYKRALTTGEIQTDMNTPIP